VLGHPVGVDIVELPFLFELQGAGVDVRDAQQTMLDARQIKSTDEIIAALAGAAMVDGVYQDIFEALKPGVRENEIVALANKRLYEMGSDQVGAINAVSGERCNPHLTTSRIGLSDLETKRSSTSSTPTTDTERATTAPSRGQFDGSSRDAYAQAREWMDKATDLVRPGVGTDVIAKSWPRPRSSGSANEMAAFRAPVRPWTRLGSTNVR